MVVLPTINGQKIFLEVYGNDVQRTIKQSKRFRHFYEKMTTDAIAYCINDLVEEEGKTVEEILKMNKWDFIVKANNWL